jgi:hypothetical protein
MSLMLRIRNPLRAGLLALVLCACASTQNRSEAPIGEPATPIGATPLPDPDLGKFLGDLSNAISDWVQKTWSASTGEDARKQDLLGTWISEQAHRRKDDLLRELETGPLRNRIVAAAALGFTRSPEVLPPLLAALHDPSDKVRSNALLGLTLLQSPDTPPQVVCEILSRESDSKLRWTAIYCLRSLAEVGVDHPCMRRSARLALSDSEPMVRSQAALLLGYLGDVDSIPQIAALLYDSVPLVSAAASRAIAGLGRSHPEHKGPAARALVQAMEEGKRELRTRILGDLVALSGHNYALDVSRWKEWSARLP